MSQRCGLFIGYEVVRIAKKGIATILHGRTYRKCKHWEGNKTYRKCKQSEGIGYSLKNALYFRRPL